MVPGFVYESCTDQIRSEPIPQLIFGLAYLLILTRFIWPLQLPLSIKILVAALALVALQFHRWSKLSSGSVFSPEFPRPVVVLLNWAFGAIVLLALLQLALDVGLLIHGGIVSAPDGVRYGLAAVATVAAAVGVHQAMRIPPLKDIEVGIHGLPRQFDGYTILQLTDLHISRLFPASWARAVVERSNKLGVDLIAITGDLIDGTLDARRADIEPLRDLKATDGVYVISGNHEYIFGYSTWMAHFAELGLLSLENKAGAVSCQPIVDGEFAEVSIEILLRNQIEHHFPQCSLGGGKIFGGSANNRDFIAIVGEIKPLPVDLFVVAGRAKIKGRDLWRHFLQFLDEKMDRIHSRHVGLIFWFCGAT